MTDNVTPNPDSSESSTEGVFEQLVGPGKKFATKEDLAKGKLNSDSFVDKLTDETKQLRDLLAAQMQEIETLKAKSSILDRMNVQSAPSQEPSPDKPTVAGLSQDDVLKLIEVSKQKELAEKNILETEQTLRKTLGADAVAFIRQKSVELGMDVEGMYQIATRSPTAFYNMLGINPNGASNGSMYVGNSTDSKNKGGTQIRNKAFYDDMAVKMGRQKFVMDRNIQLQLHKDMQALGDAFFS